MSNRNRRRNNRNNNYSNRSGGRYNNNNGGSRGAMPPGLKKLSSLSHGKNIVACAYWSEKGKIFSAGGNSIKMWDGNTSKCEHTITIDGEIGSILCMQGWLFCGYQAASPPIFPETQVGHLKAWNLAVQPPAEYVFKMDAQTPFCHPNKVTALTALMDKGLVISAGREGLIKVWRFDTTQGGFVHHCTLSGHVRNVTSLLMTPEGILYSAGEDYTIRKWVFSPDMTAKCADYVSSAKQGHTNTITGLVLVKTNTPQGPLVALISASRDKTVKVWNTKDLSQMFNKDLGSEVLSVLTVAKDGYAAADCPGTLFIGMVGGEIKALGLPAFQELGQVNRGGIGHQKSINDLQMGPPPGHFFSGSVDGNMFVWSYQQPGAPTEG